jgi:RimJ/RimL family protein N-acetyltransferase
MFPDLLRDDVFRLETGRLWLRWPRMADSPALLRHAGDPAVAHMTASIPYPYTGPDAARWIFSSRAGNAQGSSLVLVMARKGKPTEAFGSVGLHQTRPGVALLGYWLGAAFQGKGLATEAVSAIIDLAFRVGDVNEVHAQAFADNAQSHRVLAKCGFRNEGRGQIDLPARGGVFACERFRLEREPPERPAFEATPVGEAVSSPALC